MRRSRPMGIRACSGIRLYEKKNKNVSDNKTESEVGKRLQYVEDFDSKINENPKTKYFYTFSRHQCMC